MNHIGQASYQASMVMFAILTVLLLSRWRGRQFGNYLILASFTSVIWSLIIVLQYTLEKNLSAEIGLSEIARDFTWFLLIFEFLKRDDGEQSLQSFKRVVLSACGIGFSLFLLAGYTPFKFPISSYWVMLILAVLGLVTVEQAYRNTVQQHLHFMKFIYISLTAIFAYDIYLYGQATLEMQISADLWQARGAINAVIAPLIAITISRTNATESYILPSRQVVFYSASLIGAGTVLLIMAAAGYYIKLYGGEWGRVLQVIIGFSTFLIIVIAFTSADTRAFLKVLLNKHFFNLKYDYREEWLRLIHLLSTPTAESKELFSRAIRAIADIFDSPGGILYLNNGNDYFNPVESERIPTEHQLFEQPQGQFLEKLHDEEWVFIIDQENYPTDDRYHLLLPNWVKSIKDAWIVLPLINEGNLIGFLILLKPRVNIKISWEDLDLLRTAGRQVASYLERHQKTELLSQAKQFDAYHKLTAFIVHDLKNLIAQQSLVVKNAAKHKSNPEFVEDAIETIANSVERMQTLLSKLYSTEAENKVHQPVPVNKLLMEAFTKCRHLVPVPSLTIRNEEAKIAADPDQMIMVFTHIIKNAQQATAEDGFVDVKMYAEGNKVVVEVEDNGEGMSEAFIRERLFKPFDSTKSSKGMGIGAYQAQEIVRSLRGDIQVESTPKIGSIFIIKIPLAG